MSLKVLLNFKLNNIAKINNQSISTQDFINHLNSSNIDTNVIKENIDDNILEELLGNLISKTLIDMEIEELNIFISESSLAESKVNSFLIIKVSSQETKVIKSHAKYPVKKLFK